MLLAVVGVPVTVDSTVRAVAGSVTLATVSAVEFHGTDGSVPIPAIVYIAP
jgi:hypothetical protein